MQMGLFIYNVDRIVFMLKQNGVRVSFLVIVRISVFLYLMRYLLWLYNGKFRREKTRQIWGIESLSTCRLFHLWINFRYTCSLFVKVLPLQNFPMFTSIHCWNAVNICNSVGVMYINVITTYVHSRG